MGGLYPGFYPGPDAYPGTPTGPRLTAIPEPANSPPRVRLELYQASAVSGTVYRYGPDNHPVPVRTAEPAVPVGGSWVGWDYEAQFNVPNRWIWTPDTGTQLLTSDSVTLAADGPWLVHPGVPSLSCRVTVKLIDTEQFRSSGTVHDVLSSEYGIPVTDGRRKAASFQMLLRTTTSTERTALEQLFQDEAPLLLQVIYPFTGEYVYRWVWVGDIDRARRSATRFGDAGRIWTLPCVEVGRPAGGVQPQRTFADSLAQDPTFADSKAKYRTFRGRLTGIPGT